ncbi:MAG: rhomboid family intramembrane serine protease, partial [Lentisphaeraceae bacterium]|nr:rhomboid family intramembrane serine protease [Lentisphaeraceae bacterium]
MSIKIKYNSPLILTYSLLSAVILLVSIYVVNLIPYLGLSGRFNWSSPQHYFNLVSYAMVHDNSSFRHFVSNFTIILLIGPALEEKYGAGRLLTMMLVTAVVTGLLNILIFRGGIIGASGIALMMIILSSFTNYSKGDLPLTFVIICIFF